MTPGRLAIIIISELHAAGFMNTNNVNGPSAVAEKAIRDRITYGDVKCIPDQDELTDYRLHTDGHGDGDYDH